MNVSDSELISGLLSTDGYRETKNINNAGIILVNTCAIREHAEDKVNSRLGFYKQIKEKNPITIIGVLGCMAQNLKENILESKPYVDIVLGPDSYRNLLDMIKARNSKASQIIDTNLSRDEVYENISPVRDGGVNAWISIMRGCDKFCTFCVIPYRRGREVSRTIDEIIFEIETLANNGTLEVTLLGQNVDSYGHDLNPKVDLSDLLIEVEKIPMIKRIRFLTSHPNDMSIKLLETIGSLDKICESVNLPFQSGSDRILANMRRGYTRDQYLSKIDQIKFILPNSTITTDLIVGFPGEKEEDFEDSIDILKKVKFDKVHVAAYSERKGTYAFRKIDDNIPVNIKRLRLNKVNRLQEEIQLELNNKYLNSVYKILIDGKTKDRFYGRTLGDKLVYIKDINASDLGSIIETEINEVSPYSLSGSKI